MTAKELRAIAQRFVTSVPSSCHVYTPEDLANALVFSLRDEAAARWLEPSVGGGAFLAALHKIEVPACRIRGVDLVDWPTPMDAYGQVLRGTEFLAWSRRTPERFDRIVANPPYARLSQCSEAIRREAEALRIGSDIPVSMRANLWYAFFLAAIRCLAPGGNLGFILPAAFDYADYCSELRRQLPQSFQSVTVLRCDISLFREPPVEGGALVVIGMGYRARRIASAKGIQHIRVSDRNDMVQALKNLHSPAVSVALTGDQLSKTSRTLGPVAQQRFGNFATIRIGAVTGDSRFFVITEQRRVQLGLPTSACLPIVSRGQHLSHGVIGLSLWQTLLADGERVWLFRPAGRTLKNPSVQAYLQLPESAGGCRRQAFKVINRETWYEVQIPKQPHALLSPAVPGVPLVALVTDGIVATNTLYFLRFPHELSLEQRAALLLSLYAPQSVREIERLTRRYTGGLRKLEPSDFAALPVVPPLGNCKGSDTQLRSVARLAALGHLDAAIHAASSWLDALARRSEELNRSRGV